MALPHHAILEEDGSGCEFQRKLTVPLMSTNIDNHTLEFGCHYNAHMWVLLSWILKHLPMMAGKNNHEIAWTNICRDDGWMSKTIMRKPEQMSAWNAVIGESKWIEEEANLRCRGFSLPIVIIIVLVVELLRVFSSYSHHYSSNRDVEGFLFL